MGYPRTVLALTAALILIGLGLRAQPGRDPLAEPFKGVTANGTVVDGLFPIRATGVTTAPVRQAAARFLALLTPDQRKRTAFGVDDGEWRLWNNIHRYTRQGISFKEMTDGQRDRAFGLLRASLSTRGLETSRAIMRLNGHLAELVQNFEEYGEGLYHLTVMGEPSDSEPWGWQLDGHHLIINYFVQRDQVVMTPTFMGSEPVSAETGQYAGTVVLQDEQNAGLVLLKSLSDDQRKKAVVAPEKPGNNAQAQAFRDNLVLDYAGIRATDLTAPQQKQLMEVVSTFVGHLDEGHAKIRIDEVRARLNDTYFAWVGGTDVFYYRIHSPVILIEFDHQLPVALGGPRVPGRRHIHTVVRTPNGNDYGKDLLRQHYEVHRHDPAHGHR
ncbi:MAG: DUF3500 domain-containing protein [Vicinamibacterales bacterium]